MNILEDLRIISGLALNKTETLKLVPDKTLSTMSTNMKKYILVGWMYK